jgi:hypothetical protein
MPCRLDRKIKTSWYSLLWLMVGAQVWDVDRRRFINPLTLPRSVSADNPAQLGHRKDHPFAALGQAAILAVAILVIRE